MDRTEDVRDSVYIRPGCESQNEVVFSGEAGPVQYQATREFAQDIGQVVHRLLPCGEADAESPDGSKQARTRRGYIRMHGKTVSAELGSRARRGERTGWKMGV